MGVSMSNWVVGWVRGSVGTWVRAFVPCVVTLLLFLGYFVFVRYTYPALV